MNLVCENFSCDKVEALKVTSYCSLECWDCKVTDDTSQCLVCRFRFDCFESQQRNFKRCWREYFQQFGGIS